MVRLSTLPLRQFPVGPTLGPPRSNRKRSWHSPANPPCRLPTAQASMSTGRHLCSLQWAYLICTAFQLREWHLLVLAAQSQMSVY